MGLFSFLTGLFVGGRTVDNAITETPNALVDNVRIKTGVTKIGDNHEYTPNPYPHTNSSVTNNSTHSDVQIQIERNPVKIGEKEWTEINKDNALRIEKDNTSYAPNLPDISISPETPAYIYESTFGAARRRQEILKEIRKQQYMTSRGIGTGITDVGFHRQFNFNKKW